MGESAEGRPCELCGGVAAVHCEADAAYLCWRCDALVHGANFLVARHVRRAACAACGALYGLRGSAAALPRPLCPSCRDLSAPSSPASSSCISTAESSAAPEGHPPRSRRTTRAEAVLVVWGRRMGLINAQGCARKAAHVLSACGREASALPLRVALAAALWHAAKAYGEYKRRRPRHVRSTCESLLERLEACSHVPAKVIVLAEGRLARAAKRARRANVEGWAECT